MASAGHHSRKPTRSSWWGLALDQDCHVALEETFKAKMAKPLGFGADSFSNFHIAVQWTLDSLVAAMFPTAVPQTPPTNSSNHQREVATARSRICYDLLWSAKGHRMSSQSLSHFVLYINVASGHARPNDVMRPASLWNFARLLPVKRPRSQDLSAVEAWKPDFP